ncbi:MAG: LysM peptidoglycan-binding domain-containing protein [Elusimicrobiota bacterium]|jgi:hypothetical protein
MRFLAALSLFLCAWSAFGQGIELQDVTVRPGDTLWSISQKYLKDPTQWDKILKHNRLPSSDPTVALPGMVLRVPKELIKEDLRSAELVHLVRKVLSRKKDKADWAEARLSMDLFHGDGLRTLSDSWARVRFYGGGLLSVDPDSMAILKAPRKEDHDLRLMSGGVHVMQARVATPSARIVPKGKDTSYSARVLDDLSTRVQVFKGLADVHGAGKIVEVREGFFTDVSMDRAPAMPSKIPNFGEIKAEFQDLGTPGSREAQVALRRTQGVSGETLRGPAIDGQAVFNMKELEVGVPVAAYHVQVSRSETFEKILFDRLYDVDEGIDLGAASLGKGRYWARIAVVDLLGTKGRFSAPREFTVGNAVAAEETTGFKAYFEVQRPAEDRVQARGRSFRAYGKTERGVGVRINGQPVPVDEEGFFSLELPVQVGSNMIRFEAEDSRGNVRTFKREVVIAQPY